MNTPMKIAIATPFYDFHGWSPYIRSMIASAFFIGRYTQVELDFWCLDGDAYVWRARNNIAKRFLESDYEWLMFIDSDEEFGAEDMLKLWAHTVPIVGAGYPCKNNWDFYGCIIHTHPDGRPIVRPDGLIKARIVPTGFMKIHRSVFEALAEKFPDDYYIGTIPGSPEPVKTMNFFGHLLEEHEPLGEDTSFSIRCERAGIELLVEPDITITHWGNKGWKGNYHEALLSYPGGSNSENPSIPQINQGGVDHG